MEKIVIFSSNLKEDLKIEPVENNQAWGEDQPIDQCCALRCEACEAPQWANACGSLLPELKGAQNLNLWLILSTVHEQASMIKLKSSYYLDKSLL